jgi:hypothetical protein
MKYIKLFEFRNYKDNDYVKIKDNIIVKIILAVTTALKPGRYLVVNEHSISDLINEEEIERFATEEEIEDFEIRLNANKYNL